MSEVTGPIIATALVLCAVFVPTAFISGLTGQFYKQFAITIAISTVISAFNSLTLSPALCAVLLKDHHAPKDWFARVMDKALGWFFRPFNRAVCLGRQQIFRRRRQRAAQERHRAGCLWRAGASHRLEFQQSPDRLRADAG